MPGGPRVPQAGSLACPHRREQSSFRAVLQPLDPVRVISERNDLRAALHVPYLERMVAPARHDPAAVGTEPRPEHVPLVTPKDGEDAPRRSVTEFDDTRTFQLLRLP